MTRQAFLFPGQGSQRVGMGRDLFETTGLGRRLYEQANTIMGMDIASLSFNGPEETLMQTAFTQPSVFIVSVILGQLLLERGYEPPFSAGHSLGEYSALTVSGAFTFEAGLEIVKIRSQAMREAGISHPGTMAAIIGLDGQEVSRICRQVSREGVVEPANFNSQDQIVISGDIAAVNKAMEIARQRGARRTIKLKVSGAFHSPLMSPAKETVKEALKRIEIRRADFPVVMNVSAEPTTDPEQIRQNLADQLDHPVRWLETIVTLKNLRVEEFIEVGPGNVLQGLNKRVDRSLATWGVESLEQVENFAHA